MSSVESYYDENGQAERGIRMERRLMLLTLASPNPAGLEIYSEWI
jgi:hypothetical protein